MKSLMNTSFFKISKEMEKAASCSKMKGIYIYIKEDKEIKTNTEKKKTFTAWKTECSE